MAAAGGVFLVHADTIQDKIGEFRFNQYVASIKDANVREATLADRELADYMKRFDFWYPADTRKATATGMLPLSDYPLGSYFSINGKACDDTLCPNHNKATDGCDFTIPAGFPTDRCYNLHTQKSGNCKRYNNAIQCKAFADYAYKQYWGVLPTSLNFYGSTSIPDAVAAKAFFQTLPVGTHVRGALSNGTPHSYIIQEKTDNGITVYDANGGASHCQVNLTKKSWAQLATWMPTIKTVWYG